MIELAIMLEGQNGLNWGNFQRIARAVEDLGFAGLYRSDHYTNAEPPDRDSLELWVSLAWLASHTSRIEFGPLVSPVSFRHPTLTARMAAAVDDLSGGRLTLGLGAGWQQREHHNYGHSLLDVEPRFRRFGEALEVITKLLQSREPVSFAGKYYFLEDAILLPRPHRPSGPPILIGGNGPRRTLPLAAKYANTWNGVYLTPAQFQERSAVLSELAEKEGRQPETIRRTLMTGCWFAVDGSAIEKRIAAHPRFSSRTQLRERGVIVGAPSELVDQIGELEEAGVERVMLQWLDLDDIDGLEVLARDVLPQVSMR
jgi:F420-dependent oxidoreductase-like protein